MPLRPKSLIAGVQALIMVVALVGARIVYAADSTPGNVSGQSAESIACAKVYGELLRMGEPPSHQSKDYTRDSVGTVKRMREVFNLFEEREGKTGACREITRGGCAIVTMYTDPRSYEGRSLTPAERQQLKEMQNTYPSDLTACQRILGCEVVSCSELNKSIPPGPPHMPGAD